MMSTILAAQRLRMHNRSHREERQKGRIFHRWDRERDLKNEKGGSSGEREEGEQKRIEEGKWYVEKEKGVYQPWTRYRGIPREN